jgi:flagellar biosynthesis/type III secretory pathway M-ring protein FliF/YscJ
VEGLIGQIASILSGDTVSLIMKVVLLVGVPLITGLVILLLNRKAAAEKLEKERKDAEEQEKKDQGTVIDGNQKDATQGRTDQETSEEERQKLLDSLKKPQP